MNLLGKFLLKIASILLFVVTAGILLSSCSSSSSPSPSEQKPESIVVPVAVLGEVSDIRRKILQNTLNETISTKFRIVPQERFEEAQEQAFQELDYEECTEDQCIMLIQEMLQVEHLFQLEVIAEGQMIQLSLKLATLYEKKNKTDLCEKCTTRQLIDSVRQLTLNLLSEVDTSEMDVVYSPPAEVKKKEVPQPKKVDPKPKVEKPTPAARQEQDAGVEGVRDDSLAGESTKKTPKREEPKEVIEEPEPESESSEDDSNDFRIRALSGSYSGDNTEVSNLSYSFHWLGFGLGMSNLNYKLTSSGNSYELTGKTYDLSYTSGDSWSWTVAYGTVASGTGTISSSLNKYETSKVSGSTFSGLIGIGWGSIEGLVGYQSFSLNYEGFKNQSGVTLTKPFSGSVGLILLGIGVSF